jgi:hypothetical protein
MFVGDVLFEVPIPVRFETRGQLSCSREVLRCPQHGGRDRLSDDEDQQ